MIAKPHQMCVNSIYQNTPAHIITYNSQIKIQDTSKKGKIVIVNISQKLLPRWQEDIQSNVWQVFLNQLKPN